MAKVLQWIETDRQYIAVLQSRELFNEDSFFEDRHKNEAIKPTASKYLAMQLVRLLLQHKKSFSRGWNKKVMALGFQGMKS